MTRFICIASGKGGVGKTTAVVNLGTALARFGYNTVIVDANVSTPNVGLHLGMHNNTKTIHDVLTNKSSIFEVMYNHPNGTKVVLGKLSVWNSRSVNYDKLANEVSKLNGACDIVLLDCSAGINSEASSAIKAANELYLVTNPSLPALTDALKTIELAKSLGTEPKGIILNMHTGKDYELSKINVEEFLGLPIITTVPEDERVKRSLTKKRSVIEAFPNSKASIGFMKAAARIVGQEYKDIAKQGLLSKLKRLLR